MKFIIMVCATFLARVKPVSTSANPACMNMTRKPVSSVHITLIETRLWPANSATSASVGLPASLAVPSPMPPVAVPAGSGFDGGGAGAVAGAGVAGAAGLSWAKTQPPTARRQASTRPKTTLHGSERVLDPASFMRVSPSAAACGVARKKKGARIRAPLPAATPLSRGVRGSKPYAAGRGQRRRKLSGDASATGARRISIRPGLPTRRAPSILLVVEKLRVDGQHAALALLLELHDAVDRGENPIAEQLVAPLPERVAVHADQLHQAVLERIRRQREVGPERHRGGRHRGLDVDAHGRRERLRLVGVQPMLAVERGGEVCRILGADRPAEILVAQPARDPCPADFLERCCSVHGFSSVRLSLC